MIRVVTDSTADLPKQIAHELGIEIVPVLVEADGVTYRDGADLPREQFFAQLPNYRECKTAAPPVADFIAAHERQIAQGATEIVSIHIGRRYSALCDAATLAAQEISARGVPVHVIDSGTLTVCLGWMALQAAELARQNAGLNDIVSAIDAMRPRGVIYAMADTLKYLRRSGRVSALTAGIGDLLQIKLLVEVGAGDVRQFDRVRTRNRGLQRLIEASRELAERRGGVQRMAVLHSGGAVMDDVQYVQAALADMMPLDQQWMMSITPVIGAHFGPRGVGVAVLTSV
ncbi:MAG: DegV family protein [Anaerolineae bacterium]|nr:DegV family protein [Thermoflexales bacterium]MDW8408002.1 DegV family protein [Anaerolineae bacterium]